MISSRPTTSSAAIQVRPVIDRQGRVIGAAFDGNIHSLGGNYGYDGSINRTVVVSTAAVQEALEKIYPAPNLVAELKGK
jgi:hypothetical protein